MVSLWLWPISIPGLTEGGRAEESNYADYKERKVLIGLDD